MPTQNTNTSASPTLGAIDRMLEIARQEAQSLASPAGPAKGATEGGLPSGTRGATGAAPASIPADVARKLEDLDLVTSRLRSIRDWLTQDPRLIPLVDDYIGQQVRAMEVRQSRQNVGLAVVTTLVGAALGWLVSLAGTPQTLLHLLGR